MVPEKVIVKLGRAMAEGCRPYGECDKDRLERPLAEFAWKYGTAALQKKKEKRKTLTLKAGKHIWWQVRWEGRSFNTGE